jgi:hypothetical protein
MAPGARSGQWSGPQFETLVLKAFRDAFLEYCGQAVTDQRVDPERLRVRITVLTATAQHETLSQEIRAFVERTFHRDMPGTRLESLTFSLDPGIGEPGYRIEIQPALPGYTTDPGSQRHPPLRPVATPGMRTTPKPPALATTPTPTSDDVVESSSTSLLLIFDTRLTWDFPLFAADAWLPLGRGLPEHLPSRALRIADHLTAIPRGALLELRYQRGDVHLRRTYERPDCAVFVDGLRLHPGDSCLLDADGTVDFVFSNTLRSMLTYQLTQKD